MVTITKKINLYEYNELNEKAKERAKENYLETKCEIDNDIEIISEFERASDREIKDWQVMEIRKMIETVFEKLEKAEREIEDYGYKFFYEVSDEEMKEDADAKGILYLNDGTEYFD